MENEERPTLYQACKAVAEWWDTGEFGYGAPDCIVMVNAALEREEDNSLALNHVLKMTMMSERARVLRIVRHTTKTPPRNDWDLGWDAACKWVEAQVNSGLPYLPEQP